MIDFSVYFTCFVFEVPVWRIANSFFGKKFIWCLLHNFGGSIGIYGRMHVISKAPIEDFYDSQRYSIRVRIRLNIRQSCICYAWIGGGLVSSLNLFAVRQKSHLSFVHNHRKFQSFRSAPTSKIEPIWVVLFGNSLHGKQNKLVCHFSSQTAFSGVSNWNNFQACNMNRSAFQSLCCCQFFLLAEFDWKLAQKLSFLLENDIWKVRKTHQWFVNLLSEIWTWCGNYGCVKSTYANRSRKPNFDQTLHDRDQ